MYVLPLSTIKRRSGILFYRKGRLASYQGTTFEYNAFGQRISKKKYGLTVTYRYYENKLYGEDHGTYKLRYIYGGKGIIGVIYQDANGFADYLFRKNIFGDIIGLCTVTDSGCELQAEYIYDARGNCKVLDEKRNETTLQNHIGIISFIATKQNRFISLVMLVMIA